MTKRLYGIVMMVGGIVAVALGMSLDIWVGVLVGGGMVAVVVGSQSLDKAQVLDKASTQGYNK